MADISPSIRIFVCYAHRDESLLNRFKKQLRPFLEQGIIEVWHDRDISPGVEWEPEISSNLDAAHVILLLISPDFMESSYCRGVEMKRALERHERGDAKVIPIILRPAHWQDILGNIQALPSDARPVTSWSNQDKAFFDIADGLRKIIKNGNALSPNPDMKANNPTELGDDKPVASRSYIVAPTPSDSYQFEGDDGRLTPPFTLQEGLYRAGITYRKGSPSGPREYVYTHVYLYDGRGDRIETLFSESGAEYTQEKLLKIARNGPYMLEIHARGHWELKIDRIS